VKKRVALLVVLCVAFSMILPSLAWAAGPISNTLTLTVTVGEEEPEPIPPSILIHNDLALESAVGLYDYFTVSMVPGDYEGEEVRVKFQVTPATGFKLEYLEDGEYQTLSVDEDGVGWFGPAGGFSLTEDASKFRVTWKTAGTYNCTMSIMTGDDFAEKLGEDKSVSIVVQEGHALALTHATAEARAVASAKNPEDLATKINELNLVGESLTIQVTENGEFDYVVAADLNDVSHVDNVLFIFEVTKDGIKEGDFEITEISLRSDTEGINETFKLVDGKLKGYWGPEEGFLFKGSAATAFTVKFKEAGSYSVQVYAIQVDK
jgi:hypothetical protein